MCMGGCSSRSWRDKPGLLGWLTRNLQGSACRLGPSLIGATCRLYATGLALEWLVHPNPHEVCRRELVRRGDAESLHV
jgi:hypothetical protein